MTDQIILQSILQILQGKTNKQRPLKQTNQDKNIFKYDTKVPWHQYL